MRPKVQGSVKDDELHCVATFEIGHRCKSNFFFGGKYNFLFLREYKLSVPSPSNFYGFIAPAPAITYFGLDFDRPYE